MNDQGPGSTLVVYPTLGTAEDVSRTRIQPVINSHDRLKVKTLGDRHLFTTTRMHFAGMALFPAGSNRATSLAGKPCEEVLLGARSTSTPSRSRTNLSAAPGRRSGSGSTGGVPGPHDQRGVGI